MCIIVVKIKWQLDIKASARRDSTVACERTTTNNMDDNPNNEENYSNVD